MNKESVPQDKDNYLDKKFKTIVYAIDKDGSYTKVPSIGWEPENIALKQAWDSINELLEQTKNKVIAGELSPIAYYMEKFQFRVKRLANLTGLPKWKVKKHLNPKGFAKINQETLVIYSNVFQISVDELIKPFKIDG
jgi:hypothetical protein